MSKSSWSEQELAEPEKAYCAMGLITKYYPPRLLYGGEVSDPSILHLDGSECGGNDCEGNAEIIALKEFKSTFSSICEE